MRSGQFGVVVAVAHQLQARLTVGVVAVLTAEADGVLEGRRRGAALQILRCRPEILDATENHRLVTF